MDQAPSMGVYLPQSQHPDFYYRLLVRTSGDPGRILPAVRRALREIDPNQAIFHLQPMAEYIKKSLASHIFGLSLTGMLGMLALGLAAIGVYGVVGYAVSLRTREIGIRIAIGADRLAVLRLVMSDVLAMISWGLAAGLLMALSLSRLLAHMLLHLNAMDALVTITAAVFLAGAALAAGFVPCLRALSVNPSTALRRF